MKECEGGRASLRRRARRAPLSRQCPRTRRAAWRAASSDLAPVTTWWEREREDGMGEGGVATGARSGKRKKRAKRRPPALLAHHLAGRKDQGGRLGVPDAHDDGRETLWRGENREGVREEQAVARPGSLAPAAGAAAALPLFAPLSGLRPPPPPPPHPLPLFSLTLGLYAALRACRAMFFRSSLQSRLTVATTFWRVGTMPDGWRARSTVSGAPTATARAVEGPAASAMRRCACARRCALGSTAEKRRARGVGEGERNGGGGPRKAVGRPARACSCAFPLSLSGGGVR